MNWKMTIVLSIASIPIANVASAAPNQTNYEVTISASPATGMGASLSRYATHTLAVGIQYERFLQNYLQGSSSVAILAKQFIGENFYVSIGMRQRSFALRNTSSSFEVTNPTAGGSYEEVKDLGVEYNLGNQWRWDNLTIGCDWVGFFQRFLTISERDVDVTIHPDGSKSRFAEDKVTIGPKGGTVLRFYAGYMF